MIARVTLAEVDAMRTSVDAAVERFHASVMPALEAQQGYAGCYVLTTPEGKALVVTFWRTAEAAEAGLASGLYGEQVDKFATIFRTPPGRETYEVSIARPPVLVTSDGPP
jgi:heme-degrading monooxygenase HmoA